MADLGYRDNVMGPQPIATRKPVPQEMLDSVHRMLDLLAAGKANELAALAVDSAKDETSRIASGIKAGTYNDKKVIAMARTSEHYWIKARMTGPEMKPFIIQLRVGQVRVGDGEWLIWEATNLTDAKSGWTK